MATEAPSQGLRKWQAFKTALVYYTVFDVWNVTVTLAGIWIGTGNNDWPI